jgi:hypothetical protein
MVRKNALPVRRSLWEFRDEGGKVAPDGRRAARITRQGALKTLLGRHFQGGPRGTQPSAKALLGYVLYPLRGRSLCVSAHYGAFLHTFGRYSHSLIPGLERLAP